MTRELFPVQRIIARLTTANMIVLQCICEKVTLAAIASLRARAATRTNNRTIDVLDSRKRGRTKHAIECVTVLNAFIQIGMISKS
jgi:predicted secreted protein